MLLGTRARRPVGPRPAGLAAARRHRRDRSASRGARTLAAHLGHGLDGEEGDAASEPPLRRRPAAGRPVRVVRRAAAGAARPTGARAATPTARAAPLDADLAGSPSSGAGCSTRVGRAAARRAARGDRGAAARGRRRARPAGAALAVRAHPAAGHRGRAARRARRAPRRPPVAAAALAARSGTRSAGRRPGPVPRARGHARPSGSATRCSASLGRDARELQRTPRRRPARSRRDRCAGARRARRRLAARLAPARPARQRARPTRDPRAPGARPGRPVACRCTPATAPARQVEVLREVLLGLLDDDPTLEPRDILVMCPDIETYAPLIAGRLRARRRAPASDGHPGHRLRVRLADRALRRPTRCSRVAGRAARPRRRPGHGHRGARPGRAPSRCAAGSGSPTTTSSRLARWVDRGRRPLGPRRRPPRRRSGSAASPQNTWRVRPRPDPARRRDERRRPPARSAAALPLDDVGSGDIDLVGRLAELRRPARRRRRRALARRPGRRATGSTALRDGVARADRRRRRRRLAGRRSSSASWPGAAGVGGRRRASTLRLRRRPRAARPTGWRGRPTRANFRTGTLTVCTMVPMRSVPHRVVCLLGLDDGVFPRAGSVDGDDVLARRPADRRARPAQRGPPAAARRDRWPPPRRWWSPTPAPTSTPAPPRPPAVPLGELLDAARPHRDRGGRSRDARPGPAPAAALRRAQLDAGRAGRRRGRSASTAPRWPAPGPRGATAHAAAAVPRPARCRRADRRGRRRSPTCTAFLEPPGARRSCAQRLDVAAPLDDDEAERRAPGRRSTPWSSGRSATGCSRDLLGRRGPDRRRCSAE